MSIVSSIQGTFGEDLCSKAVSIITPFPKRVPLSRLKISKEALEFVNQYLPSARKGGLYLHQWKALDTHLKGIRNIIMTTATGSGKSLCFWTWVIDCLSKKPDSTALLCFPTQALMWGQSERLANISIKSSLKYYDAVAYSGILKLGKKEIGWSAWKGTSNDENMEAHQDSDDFTNARIRLSTLDKAHYSLIGSHVDFTKNLECLVLDEAHLYDGIFGANVMYLIKRICLAKQVAGYTRPRMFFASATLSEPLSFASKLMSCTEDEIFHCSDAGEPKIVEIDLKEADHILDKPPKECLARVVLFVDSTEDENDLVDILRKKGPSVRGNTVLFSNSKFHSRLTARDLRSVLTKTDIIVYDASIPTAKRRDIEHNFQTARGSILIATNALELGIDIDTLDFCIIDKIPPKRVDLIQRVGRVGRRDGRPGLALVNLTSSPLDQYIMRKPSIAFSFDSSKIIPIPDDLELLRLKNIEAAHYEGCYREYAKPAGVSYDHYLKIGSEHFGEFPDKEEVKEILSKKYPGLIDMVGRFWVYKGFRASASQGLIPLKKVGEGEEEVARIEDIAIFRDAHPEAIYLDDEGHRWRVISYGGDWKEATWKHPDSKIILAKFFKTIKKVLVEEVKGRVVTRGKWKEETKIYEQLSPPNKSEGPVKGKLAYGIWDYSRKFNGYDEYDLSTREWREVPLTDISARFKDAVESGGEFPFLFPFSYRSYGWQWDFEEDFSDVANRNEMEELVTELMNSYFADSVQASPANVEVTVSLAYGFMRVVDTTPGGNGLSEALLVSHGVSSAFSLCLEQLHEYETKSEKKFQYFLSQIAEIDSDLSVKEVMEVVERLQSLWSG